LVFYRTFSPLSRAVNGTFVEEAIMLGGIRLFLILASLFLLTAVVLASDSSNGSAQGPPQTAVQPVEETLHGHKIVDNYRWLEDGTAPETQTWVKSELEYTRAMLDPLPGRAGIEKRLTELLSIGSISAPQIAGPYFLYTKREGMQNQPVLYVRKGVNGGGNEKDRVLLDVNALAADGTVALDWWWPKARRCTTGTFSITRWGRIPPKIP
jgi:prolyl oligopeptidase